jgi:hypothetical protein
MLADTKIFGKVGDHKIGAILFVCILVQQCQAAERIVGGGFHFQIVDRKAACGIIVKNDVFPVDGLVDVGLNTKVGAISRGDEGGVGVFKLNATTTAVRDHQGLVFGTDLNGIHNLISFRFLHPVRGAF